MSRKADREKSRKAGEREKGPLLPWPDVPKVVFDFGPDHRLNMRVGWMLSDPMGMTAYVAGDGYREAAEALFEHVDKSPAVSDFVLFPFAFLWRHFVELSLKEIIVLGYALDGKQAPKKLDHRLRALWRDARPVIEKTGPKGDPALSNVEARVFSLADIDPNSQGFRYATDTGGARHALLTAES